MRTVLGSCLLSLALSAPAPQDIQIFGDFSHFPSKLPASFGFEDSDPKISLSLSDLFGIQQDGEVGKVPAIVTSLFDVLGDSLGVQAGEGEDRVVTVQEDGEYDHHNNTYEEKVLDDGTLVRINRTTIQDTDQDGNTYFFSSSVHRVLNGEDSVEENDDTFPEDVETEFEDSQDDETMEEEIRDYENEAELVPTDIDETENEVDFEKIRNRKAKAEFPGVDDTASVEGLFE